MVKRKRYIDKAKDIFTIVEVDDELIDIQMNLVAIMAKLEDIEDQIKKK